MRIEPSDKIRYTMKSKSEDKISFSVEKRHSRLKTRVKSTHTHTRAHDKLCSCLCLFDFNADNRVSIWSRRENMEAQEKMIILFILFVFQQEKQRDTCLEKSVSLFFNKI